MSTCGGSETLLGFGSSFAILIPSSESLYPLLFERVDLISLIVLFIVLDFNVCGILNEMLCVIVCCVIWIALVMSSVCRGFEFRR